MLHDYGPKNLSTHDRYENNDAYSEGCMNAFREGTNAVPGGRPSEPDVYPPVPIDTNQNIMSEAASAMSDVVASDASTAAQELDNAASAITEHARNTPDRYVAADRFDNK